VAASTSEQTTKMRFRNDTAGPLAENWTADPDVTSPPGGGKPMTTAESVGERVAVCRRAQAAWSARPVRERLRLVRTLRHSLVDAADELAGAIHRELGRPPHEALASDVLPIADACRFLECEAEGLLQPRKVKLRSRPLWLWS